MGTILVAVGPLDASPARPERPRVADVLSRAGYDVVEARSVDEAAAILSSRTFPLVVLDRVDALVDRTALTRSVKAAGEDTFVLTIARGDDPSADDDDLADATIADPIEPRHLVAQVRSLLRLQKVEADLRDSEDRLLLAQEAAGLAILDWGIADNSFVHSDNLLDLFDLAPLASGETLAPTRLLERVHPDDLAQLVAEFSTEGRSARDFDTEFRVVRTNGDIRWIASRGRFFGGAGDQPERMLSLSQDVTQRKTAERVNAEFASIVASSLDAIVGIDLAGRVTSWNAGAIALFGIGADEMLGRMLGTAFTDLSGDARADDLTMLTDGGAHEFESRLARRDGAWLDLSITSAPMRTPGGAMIGASLIMRDVSEQKAREEHVRFLMRELTHRSKNLLAVIQAMARQSVTRDIKPEEFVRKFTDRLAALAGSHDLLSGLDWKGASLMDLIRSQLSHFADLFGSRILLPAADVLIKPAAAQNIGIALHELSTNAAKYGALSNETGIVTIDWAFADGADPPMTLTWREAGGPGVVAPTRQGFGRIVMDRIVGRALGGRSAVAFHSDGVVWTLEVPSSGVLGA